MNRLASAILLGAVVTLAGCEYERVVYRRPMLSGLPGATVSQVLKTLAAAGVVASHRGARGGYELAREPEDITVRELVVAFEGPLAVTACVEGAEDNCSVEPLCLLAGGWEQVNSAIRSALDSVTLADLIRPITHFGRRETGTETVETEAHA